jgi:hypothetical protein
VDRRIVAVLVVLLVAFTHRLAEASQAGQPQPAGSVAGLVTDDTGAPIVEAIVSLGGADRLSVEVAAGTDGRFLLVNVPVGSFTLTVSAPGFATQTVNGSVTAGEVSTLPPIRLTLSVNAVAVDVTPSVVEIAERQLNEETQQRVLGFVPNFYVSFDPDAAPLNPRQKMKLSWKSHTDPVQFASVAIVAGVQYARNDYSAFGDGPSGYAKRYAAAYATVWTHAMMTQVLLPSVFRQDPRYFYKGSGSVGSRIGYAVSRSVVRRGDNGRAQPNYSGILGSFAAGALSNLYYPEEDRKGATLTLENTAIGMIAGVAGHLAQEFLWGRLTSRAAGSKTK